jgi:hypothetical protein
MKLKSAYLLIDTSMLAGYPNPELSFVFATTFAGEFSVLPLISVVTCSPLSLPPTSHLESLVKAPTMMRCLAWQVQDTGSGQPLELQSLLQACQATSGC